MRALAGALSLALCAGAAAAQPSQAAEPPESRESEAVVPGAPDEDTEVEEGEASGDAEGEAGGAQAGRDPEQTSDPGVASDPEEGAGPEDSPDPEAASDSGAVSDPEAASAPEATPDPEAAANPETVSDPEGEADPETASAPEATKPAPPPAVPPPPPPITDCTQGCLKAESQGGGDGHFWAEGFVDFQVGDLHIQSDRFDLYEEEAEDGTSSRRVVAEGNVVFVRGDERISGDKLEMDLLADTAVLENARGFVQPDVFIEARRIERLDSRTYRIEGGRFTSCYQTNPRWSFSASSANLKRDDRIAATNVVFRVKSVPTLYLPYFYYPIEDDQRSTGFLFPSFGFSSLRGFNIGTGFFWAMSRNSDQTFSVDHYSRYGIGYGHELRYVGHGSTNGTFSTTVFDRSDVDTRDYDLTWRAAQGLPGGFRGSLNARLFSSTAFQQQYQYSLDLASTRSQRAALSISGRLGRESVQFVADHNETFFSEDRSRVVQRLPSLRISRSPKRIGNTGIVFGYEARAERLARGDESGSDPYDRFDVAPTLSRPWATSFLQVEPSVSVRYTRWGTSFDEDRELAGDSVTRPLFESNVEMRGPNFSKIFSLGGFYSPRFKHEIGPEFVWTYRSPVDDFDVIPSFDGADQLLGTNQVNYALVQRLLAKRPNAAGKLVTHEVLFWRLSQTYYAQIGDGQADFDPNFSSNAQTPSGDPSHYSPILSRLRFRPTQAVRTTMDAEYDVNYKQMRRVGMGLEVGADRATISAGWSRISRLAEDAADREITSNTLRGSTQLQLVPGSVDLSGAVDYDFVEKVLYRWSARARLGVQCCGLMLEVVGFNYNERQERQFRFALELANIGSFGFDGGGQPGLR